MSNVKSIKAIFSSSILEARARFVNEAARMWFATIRLESYMYIYTSHTLLTSRHIHSPASIQHCDFAFLTRIVTLPCAVALSSNISSSSKSIVGEGMEQKKVPRRRQKMRNEIINVGHAAVRRPTQGITMGYSCEWTDCIEGVLNSQWTNIILWHTHTLYTYRPPPTHLDEIATSPSFLFLQSNFSSRIEPLSAPLSYDSIVSSERQKTRFHYIWPTPSTLPWCTVAATI